VALHHYIADRNIPNMVKMFPYMNYINYNVMPQKNDVIPFNE